MNLNDFEKIIGYSFKDEALLRKALTHSSYAHEKKLPAYLDNERLEFLGDAVLEVSSSEFLYLSNPEMPEGKLTKLRASMVCEPSLAFCAREVKLGDFLFLGNGEDLSGGRERDSILSDALEAVIGAIYLDGGFTSAKEFVMKHVLNDIENKQLFYDSKTILQEMVQSKGMSGINYEIIKTEGPEHDRTFTVRLSLNDGKETEGEGKTKKHAEQEAAYKMIKILKEI